MNLIKHYKQLKNSIAEDKFVKANANKKSISFLMMMALGFITLMPEVAMAAPWDTAATKVLTIFTGGLARTLAIISVVACGIAAMAGKLSWEWAIKIIVGIVLIFGATAIVDFVIAGAS